MSIADPMAAADTLHSSPTTAAQDQAAARTAARHAHDEDDLSLLLDVLGLPAAEDDLVQLLPRHPHAPAGPRPGHATAVPAARIGGIAVPAPAIPSPTPAEPAAAQTGPVDVSSVDAVTRSMALSMHYTDEPIDRIITATGLTQAQIDALVDAQEREFDADLVVPVSPRAAASAPGTDSAIEELIRWGEQHPTRGMQAHAAPARTALAELDQARGKERAVTAAEAKVDRLREQLARAERDLRAAKTGRPATALAVVPAPAASERLEQPADKETRQQVRAWARERGMSAPDRGLISQEVLHAWAQHSTAAPLAQAG